MRIDLYTQLGEAGIQRLVDRLYHWMAVLPEAHAAYRLHGPDLDEVKRRLAAFLSGWLGGPERYRDSYGEPMMRRRHLAFPVGPLERDAWMAALDQALNEVLEDDPELCGALRRQFASMAEHMRNRTADGQTTGGCLHPS